MTFTLGLITNICHTPARKPFLATPSQPLQTPVTVFASHLPDAPVFPSPSCALFSSRPLVCLVTPVPLVRPFFLPTARVPCRSRLPHAPSFPPDCSCALSLPSPSCASSLSPAPYSSSAVLARPFPYMTTALHINACPATTYSPLAPALLQPAMLPCQHLPMCIHSHTHATT